MFMTARLCISAVVGEKMCFREENPSRGAAVKLPRHFHEQIREDFPPFFVPFSFVLQSSTGKCSNPRLSIHYTNPWRSTFCFMYFYSRFHSFSSSGMCVCVYVCVSFCVMSGWGFGKGL